MFGVLARVAHPLPDLHILYRTGPWDILESAPQGRRRLQSLCRKIGEIDKKLEFSYFIDISDQITCPSPENGDTSVRERDRVCVSPLDDH